MQYVFKRYEKKYLVTRERGDALLELVSQHMAPDRFGEYSVRNIYYDTEDWGVIRASIEKPLYKEKLRLRCYGVAGQNGQVFLELKKKFKGIVYKRRVPVDSEAWASGGIRGLMAGECAQIYREFDFYLKANPVDERIYVAFRRVAFAAPYDGGLRVTFDTGLRFRLDALGFSDTGDERAVLPEGKTLMEIKTFGGMPLWLARALAEHGVFPTPYSKYGACYALFSSGSSGRAVANA